MPIMVQPVRFASDVQLREQPPYCICSRPGLPTHIIISVRLKEVIEQEDWSQLHTEDLEEIRSLRELGFLVNRPP